MSKKRTLPKIIFFGTPEFAQFCLEKLVAEGFRGFDLRRWRAIERVWGAPGGIGVWRQDTYGADRERFYLNANDLTYKQAYIFRIPSGERDRNPNLTQNIPWR